MQLRRLAELHRADWLVLLQLVPMATLTKLALRWVPLQKLVEGFGRSARLEFPLFVNQVEEGRLYQLADWATRLPARNTPCLVRSLLLHLMLARRGAASAITLGVSKRGGTFRSHAWVTLRGQPLGEAESALTEFKPILHLGVS
jgi:hypothetical protein